MTTGLLYFGANIIALTANLLTGVSVLVSNQRSFKARVFAGITLSSACYIVGRSSYAIPADVQVQLWIWPFLLVLMNIGTGLWMILAHSLFRDDRPVPRWMISVVAVQILLSAINAFGYVGRNTSLLQSQAYPSTVNFVFGPLPLLLQSAFAFLALYWAAREWRSDLDERRRILRAPFLVVVGGLYFGINASEFYLADSPYSSRAHIDNIITLVMAVGYVSVALMALRFDHGVFERLMGSVPALPDPYVDVTADRDFAILTRALNGQKVYRTPGLSIGSLARRLAMPEYRLRALIHKNLGYRNFNALLHEYRLRDACQQLTDPAKAHLPILTIALDAGYQSIAPFNQAFRLAMGCTPSTYRRQHTKPS